MTPNVKTFPFWVLVQRDGPGWRPLALHPDYAAAFSSASLAKSFISAHGDAKWEFRLVSRATLPLIAGSFRGNGLRGVAFDPTDDFPGTMIDFDDLCRD